MNFHEASSYLFSLGNEVEAMKLGLENIRTLLAELRNPHEEYLKVQVAGTNGKGSVCAFLDSICRQADIKTGLFTSPHLVSVTERIRIGGADITDDDFARLATRVRDVSERLVSDGSIEAVPTYFEQVTAIALVAFAEAKVELAILETGMGGRLDATTAGNAEICAITRIDLDHQEYLGDTIEEIAAEKAAIIRADSKIVLTHQARAVEQVLIGRCREVGVDPVWATTDVKIKREGEIAPMLYGTFVTERDNYPNIDLYNMLGEHQFLNGSVAVAIAEQLQDAGVRLTNFDICIGLETATHPGRLEYIGNFLLDGAHNVAGIKALCDYLDEFEQRPITLIFGAMKGKNVMEMAEILFARAESIILTRPDNSRALTAEDIAEITADVSENRRPVITNSSADAVAKARSIVAPSGLILVTGSLYLVGEVKKLLNNQ